MIDIQTRYGSFQALGVENDIIERYLQRYGEWARNEVRFVAAALPEGPLRVLDVGSYLGTFGIGLSAERPLESLVLVEANPEVTPALRENLRRNARLPATVVEAIVAPTGATLAGSVAPENLGSLSFLPTSADEGRVPAAGAGQRLSLTELRRQHGDFGLIKLDIEGLELSVLADDPDVLRPGGPALWMECNESPAALDLGDLLMSAGLTVHYFAFPAFAHDNYRGDTDPIFPFAFEAGLWASRGPSPTLEPALAEQGCILRHVGSREQLRRALWETPRWGRSEWTTASRETLAAEAAHALQEEDYAHFLADGGVKPLKRGQIEQLVYERDAQLGELNAQFGAAQEQIRTVTSELQAAYVVIEDERRRVMSMEDRVRAAEAHATVATATAAWASERLRVLESSLVWRSGLAARAILAERPILNRVVRKMAKFGFRAGRSFYWRFLRRG